MKNIFLLTLIFLFHLPRQLSATTIIPFKHLGEAAQSSEAVVLATAESRFENPTGDFVFFDCRLRVQSVVKGNFQPNDHFLLRQHAHRLRDFTVDIAGDFVPQEGKTYLLFLQRSGDAWRPVTLTYYVFETKKMGDEEFLVPVEESFGVALVPRPDGVKPEPTGVYRIAELLQTLQQYAAGELRVWDATPALTGFAPGDFPHERALPTGCDFALGANLSRWQDAAVEVYFDDTDAPAGFSATLDAVLGSMTANYPGIAPTNEDQSGFTPDCGDGTVTGNDFTAFLAGLNGDQTTYIFFEDPCGQIPNLSGCNGTLAIGGSFSSSQTHSYKGDTWNNALWGFVVVNNGVLDCLDPDEYETVLIHELTHTFRMDHLNSGDFPDQNMNPSCCNTINFKDIECMNYTYDLAAPVALTAFEVAAHPGRQVLVSWATASEKDNAYFTVERSADGVHFETIQTIPGNNASADRHYEWTDPLPYPGLNYYRLSQVDFDGRATNFGVKVVRIGEGDAAFSVFPNPSNQATVTVLIDLPFAFNGVLEITDMNGRMLDSRALVLESGRNRLEQPVNDLASGVYWLRLSGTNSTSVLKFLKN